MKISKQLLEKCGIEKKSFKQINEWNTPGVSRRNELHDVGENKEYIGIYEDWNEETEEPGELGVLTIITDHEYIYAGHTTNVGVSERYKMEIDDMFSFDENLQGFIEQLKENPESVSAFNESKKK